jgi:hypothetical protein
VFGDTGKIFEKSNKRPSREMLVELIIEIVAIANNTPQYMKGKASDEDREFTIAATSPNVPPIK